MKEKVGWGGGARINARQTLFQKTIGTNTPTNDRQDTIEQEYLFEMGVRVAAQCAVS